MNPFGLGPVVRVVNRVKDPEGHTVPFEARCAGEAFWIHESIDLPLSVARIVVHGSMYKLDPVTAVAEYRLGCADLGIPTDALPVQETTRVELVDRSLLPPERQKIQPVKLYNPIRQREAAPVVSLRSNESGVYQGHFGDH